MNDNLFPLCQCPQLYAIFITKLTMCTSRSTVRKLPTSFLSPRRSPGLCALLFVLNMIIVSDFCINLSHWSTYTGFSASIDNVIPYEYLTTGSILTIVCSFCFFKVKDKPRIHLSLEGKSIRSPAHCNPGDVACASINPFYIEERIDKQNSQVKGAEVGK